MKETNQELKKAGLKITAPRMKILQILESAEPHHLSAEALYHKLKESDADVGMATVYRVLTQFETAGLVTRHHFEGDHAVYEINQGEHHDHLVCLKCGRVEEFVDDTIEDRQRLIAKQKGFQITDHVLNIYGECAGCQG